MEASLCTGLERSAGLSIDGVCCGCSCEVVVGFGDWEGVKKFNSRLFSGRFNEEEFVFVLFL